MFELPTLLQGNLPYPSRLSCLPLEALEAATPNGSSFFVRNTNNPQSSFFRVSATSSSSIPDAHSVRDQTKLSVGWNALLRRFIVLSLQFPEVMIPNLAAPLGTPTSSSSGGPSLNFPASNLPWQTAAVEQTSLSEEEGTSGSTFLDSLTLPKLPALPVHHP